MTTLELLLLHPQAYGHILGEIMANLDPKCVLSFPKKKLFFANHILDRSLRNLRCSSKLMKDLVDSLAWGNSRIRRRLKRKLAEK